MAIGPHSIGQRGIAKRYPVTEGLTAETEKQTGRQMNMLPEKGSFVPRRKKVGLQ